MIHYLIHQSGYIMTKPPFHNYIRPKAQSLEGRKKKERWKGTKNIVPACNAKIGSVFAGHEAKWVL
jgi:hypothetical protein